MSRWLDCACGRRIRSSHAALHKCGTRARKRFVPEPRVCDWWECGKPYMPAIPTQRFCGAECRTSSQRGHSVERTAELVEARAMAPVAEEEAALRVEAEAAYSRLVVGEASYRLWGEVLGVAL